MFQMETDFLALIYSAAISASVTDIITFQMMWGMACIVPFSLYMGDYDRKKCPPERDLAFETIYLIEF